jgi:hypothetical protein
MFTAHLSISAEAQFLLLIQKLTFPHTEDYVAWPEVHHGGKHTNTFSSQSHTNN